ncbi:MAG: purine-nucleoside phosphorylase [Gemmatimonadetes bacterium]|nr:purine-nucleoside phosphorylase [Gemmatimonadota bacterium]
MSGASGATADPSAAADALRERVGGAAFDVALVLGSGLGGLVDGVDDRVEVPFGELPGFPASGVAGHAGRYVAGTLEGKRVLVQAGRFHLYEGLPLEVVCAPVRVAALLGVEVLVLTNAAGGLDRRHGPGSLVMLDDHISLMWRSPLAGAVHEGEERFPDMSAPYDRELQAHAEAAALHLGIPLARGTYAAMSGPSYETSAEIRMLGRMGADVVGMSTVPEVITARARGMRCLGISIVTNWATGIATAPHRHEEVLEQGRRAGATLERLLRRLLKEMPPGAYRKRV